MNLQHHSAPGEKKSRKRSAALGIGIGVLLIFLTMGSLSIILSEDGQTDRENSGESAQKASPGDRVAKRIDDGLWDGPVLYHHPTDKPIHLILVEKSAQKLHLYRYDGRYRKVKTYFCATGEKKGKKHAEKDEKTPEGIYFNDRTFRDRKITVFGDRAFGLNYPDVFDNLAGNKGGGIFIHGTNREVSPYSTNGCLVLDNPDIADLDKRIDIQQTPVIIGERLPYRFGTVKRDLSELVPFLKQALLPEKYAGMTAEFDALTVLGFEDRVVATGRIRIKDAGDVHLTSRLYLAGPGKTLLVMVKREWREEKKKVVLAKAALKKKASVKSETRRRRGPPGDKERLAALVESWRRAWEGKRLNAYIAHYHPAFSNKGKSLSGWKAYKGRLNKRNRKISVRVSDVRIKVDGQKARVYFRQRYRSDTFRSSSYKILEFRKNGGAWKIFRENSFARKPAKWPT